MHVIARKTLKEFWERHPDAEKALQAWFHEAKSAEWSSSADVKAKYGTASVLKSGRVVFNIAGNKYRLVAHIRYDIMKVYIRFVGAHEEYDKIDAEKV